MDCSDVCSDAWRIRLLDALAEECARLGTQIARLGDAVTAGDADSVTRQGFDAQSQTAHGLCGVLGLLCGSRREVSSQVARLPLPAMRQRLRVALDRDHVPAADDPGDTVIWLEE